MVLLCYPDYVKAGLQMFNCFNLGDDFVIEKRLMEDFSVKCWEKSHELWAFSIGLSGLIISGLGFPLFILYKLFYYNHKGIGYQIQAFALNMDTFIMFSRKNTFIGI